MTRIAILDDYQNVALDCADWNVLPMGCEIKVFRKPLGDEDAIAEALQDFDVLVAMRERTEFPASLLEKLGSLKLLITTGMHNRSMDMDAARGLGITVCGTKSLPHPAAELTWALIMALFKKIPRENKAMHEGGWQIDVPLGLNGKTIGIIGLGRQGGQVAKMAHAFGMNIIAWSRNMTPERAAEHGATAVDKAELFRQSDVVTIHMPLSERSEGLAGAPELALMKPTAFIVNTSRGPIIDETALYEAMKSEKIAGAGIDVYSEEPLPVDHPFRTLENMILTGHTGYVTLDNFEGMYSDAVENIKGWLEGNSVRVLNEE